MSITLPPISTEDAVLIGALVRRFPLGDNFGSPIDLVTEPEILQKAKELEEQGNPKHAFSLLADLAAAKEYSVETVLAWAPQSTRVSSFAMFLLQSACEDKDKTRTDALREILPNLVEDYLEELRPHLSRPTLNRVREELVEWRKPRKPLRSGSDADRTRFQERFKEREFGKWMRPERMGYTVTANIRDLGKSLFLLSAVKKDGRFAQPPNLLTRLWDSVGLESEVRVTIAARPPRIRISWFSNTREFAIQWRPRQKTTKMGSLGALGIETPVLGHEDLGDDLFGFILFEGLVHSLPEAKIQLRPSTPSDLAEYERIRSQYWVPFNKPRPKEKPTERQAAAANRKWQQELSEWGRRADPVAVTIEWPRLESPQLPNGPKYDIEIPIHADFASRTVQTDGGISLVSNSVEELRNEISGLLDKHLPSWFSQPNVLERAPLAADGTIEGRMRDLAFKSLDEEKARVALELARAVIATVESTYVLTFTAPKVFSAIVSALTHRKSWDELLASEIQGVPQ